MIKITSTITEVSCDDYRSYETFKIYLMHKCQYLYKNDQITETDTCDQNLITVVKPKRLAKFRCLSGIFLPRNIKDLSHTAHRRQQLHVT